MEYRYLGRTGIRVSPLCLGCMTFGGKTSPDEAADMIDRALAAGINFLDTANVYVDGKSEKATGKALKRNGKRDRIVLASKCHGNMHKDEPLNPNRWGNSRRQIIEQCDASLKRLKTDWIDLYQIHRPHVDCPIDETLQALDDLVRTGKVRYIGCSTFASWQVIESLWVADRHHLNRFVTEQPPYNLLDRRIERELVPMAKTYGLALIPWSPLAGGFLTGKYQRGATPTGGRYAPGEDTSPRAGEMLANERAHDVLDVLRKLSDAKGCTVSQLALAWCMNQPAITSPIIGPRTMDQLNDNLGALDVEITDDDRRAIDEVSPPGRAVYTYYEADFGPHPHRW
jgi:aryl-alcohol dehydrogenase-like predicted oxidoreductase